MIKETVLSRSLRLMFSGGVAVGLGLLTQPVLAQQTATDNTPVQRVEITGSAIKRVDAETALPVTVLKHDDIVRSGATTAQDLVNLIPSNFGGNVASQNVGATGIASTANLRNLGAKYTLVLLNGRRVANYAFGNNPVDLNSIPLSAIDRVEVLRDGASAIYGADAVAGVINFILRKDFHGLEGSLYGTSVYDGGGQTQSFNVTGGFGDLDKQGFNILLSVNHENDEVLRAKDRSFAGSAVVPALGLNKSSPRNGIPNLNFTDTLGNAYSTLNPLRYTGCNSPDFALVVRNASSCGTDYVKFIDLVPQATHDNAVVRGVFKVNENHEIYAEATYTEDKSKASYSPAPYTLQLTYPATGRYYPKSITVPKGYVVPTGGLKLANGTTLAAGSVLAADTAVTPTGDITGTWRTVAGGGRTDLTDQQNSHFLIGAKGTIGGWDYDTALSYSKNEGVISFGPGRYSYAKLTPLVAAGQINIFGPLDQASQAALDSALLTGPQQSATSTSTEADFHISKEIAKLPYGGLGLALGASARKEKLDQFSYPVLASGDDVGGNGPVPGVNGDRKVYAVFAELNIPVYKDLEAALAGRYDKYKNGFGTEFTNFSPKVGVRYQPTKQLLLRSSYGTGYRAPTLYDNLRPFTTGNNTSGTFNDPLRCPGGVPINNTVGVLQDECNVQQNTAVSGSKDLNPEKSKQYSLGLVFSPTASFNGSLDFWHVKIDDAIAIRNENQIFNNVAQNLDYIYRYDPALYPHGWVDDGKQTGAIRGSTNPNFPIAYAYQPNQNSNKLVAAGIDLDLNYKRKVADVGTFGVNYNSTLLTKHSYQYPNSAAVSDLGVYGDFGVSPKYRHALTGTLVRGGWNASLTHNYTRGYQDYTNADDVGSVVGGVTYTATRQVANYSTFDATLGYTGFKNLDLAFGIKNIGNTNPPLSRTEANFQTGYDAQYTNPLGRTFYFRAKYKFL
jgi:iron complex outermembrane receptor protein